MHMIEITRGRDVTNNAAVVTGYSNNNLLEE